MSRLPRPRRGLAIAGSLAVIGGLVTTTTTAGAATPPGVTSRASLGSGGQQADAGGVEPALSTHGRFVAFSSAASNLVPGDTNGGLVTDVFLRDRLTGVTQRVSVGPNGAQATATSLGPAVSGNGRYVAFTSAARLVAADTDALFDAYLRDTATGVNRRLSAARGGGAPNGASFGVSMSADGLQVAFDSLASNLVAGDTNGLPDVFVRDRTTGITERVSLGAGGQQGNGDSGGISNPAISANGRYVAFTSAAGNLVAGDTNGVADVFVRDRVARTTVRASVGAGGAPANGASGDFPPAISGDGRFVAFESLASNLVSGDTNGVADVFVRDLRGGVTRRMSLTPTGRPADASSEAVSISADGRIVAFASNAANLVAGDTNGTRDVFARDRWTGVTRLVSVSSGGGLANANSSGPAVSGDGAHIGFSSDATNLVPGDTNDATDVFVRDPATDAP